MVCDQGLPGIAGTAAQLHVKMQGTCDMDKTFATIATVFKVKLCKYMQKDAKKLQKIS